MRDWLNELQHIFFILSYCSVITLGIIVVGREKYLLLLNLKPIANQDV